jgi:hypothetical protein
VAIRERGGRGQQWLCGLSFVVSMRSGIGSGPLRFVPLEWLSTTGRLAQLTERRQVAHSLSSKTLFPVGYQLSNATQTMVPAPPRPHLLMASSPLRTYDQDLWSLPLKPLQSGQQTGTPSNQPPNFKLMYCPSSVDPFFLYTHFIHIPKNAIDGIPHTTEIENAPNSTVNCKNPAPCVLPKV